jgi:glycosyltransferase involved in cell wall biosynthesis
MRILFVCFTKSSTIGCNAYNQRVLLLEEHFKKLGVETEHLFLGDLFFSGPVLIQPLNLPFIFKYLKSFDLVIAEGNVSAYFFAFAKPLIGQSPLVVYDVHSDALTESRLFRRRRFDIVGFYNELQMRFNDYVALKGAEYFVFAWPNLKDRLLSRKRSIKEENTTIVLNGVDLNLFKPCALKKRTAASEIFTVAYGGSFYKVEGIEPLIRAAEILKAEDIQFKFIGFRDCDLSIKEEIQKRLGDKATLIDWLPKNELIAELCSSEILIIPADSSTRAQFENRFGLIPTKFAEYLGLAKPIIVTTLDGTSQIVEKFNCGFVCDPNAESMAKVILRAKRASTEDLLTKGLNGRKFAEAQLDVNLISRNYLQFLLGILKRSSQR